MPENTLPDAITEIMKSPQIAEILSSIGAGAGAGAGAGEYTAGKQDNVNIPAAEGFSLPPDFAQKLPAIMAALSGMGINTAKEASAPVIPPTVPGAGQMTAGGAQRKALLRALRPYLSQKRQTAVDSLIALDGISGLFSSFSDGGRGGH